MLPLLPYCLSKPHKQRIFTRQQIPKKCCLVVALCCLVQKITLLYILYGSGDARSRRLPAPFRLNFHSVALKKIGGIFLSGQIRQHKATEFWRKSAEIFYSRQIRQHKATTRQQKNKSVALQKMRLYSGFLAIRQQRQQNFAITPII